MLRWRALRGLLILAWILSLAPGSAGRSMPSSEMLRVDPAGTWVGIARVKLAVTDLQFVGRELTGQYEIEVPLRPSKNDRGLLALEAHSTIEDVIASGGRLVGRGLSESTGVVHRVDCQIETDGTLVIDVTTPERRLSFRTRYHTAPPQG